MDTEKQIDGQEIIDTMDGYVDFVGESNILDFDEDIICTCEKTEEEKEADYFFYDPFDRRTFLFYPTYKDTYYDLKEVSAELAIQYIEALINFGVDNIDIPTENPILRAVLASPVKTIRKAYTNYVLKTHKAYQDKKAEFERAYKENVARKRRERREKRKEYNKR